MQHNSVSCDTKLKAIFKKTSNKNFFSFCGVFLASYLFPILKEKPTVQPTKVTV